MSKDFDVIVIGAGPGGYVAAIRAAQLGLRTACIDARCDARGKALLGGTCLNVGCIPSKALLDSSEQLHLAQANFAAHGIRADNLGMDVAQMQKRKDEIVAALTGGIAQLFKANGVTAINGRAKLLEDARVEVRAIDSDEVTATLRGTDIILAPGSEPAPLPGIEIDNRRVVDSTGALLFERAPTRLGVIGAGAIGLELGSVWNRLGSQVVLLEAMPDFLAAADRQIAREAARQFKKQKLDIRLGATLQKIESGKDAVRMHWKQKDKTESLEVDRVIVAVGRRAATDGLLAPNCGVAVDARGLIEVDAECRTARKNIWAIGDAVRGPMLAHKSSEEGVAVAERIAGHAGHVDLGLIPWVIYTAPEIAWVGETEETLKKQGVPFKSGAFPFAATGRARAMQQTSGLVKLIAHAETDRLLGAHMLGAHVSELIQQAVIGMAFSASAEDFARTVHAHPTLSEAVHEAALAVSKRAIHKAG